MGKRTRSKRGGKRSSKESAPRQSSVEHIAALLSAENFDAVVLELRERHRTPQEERYLAAALQQQAKRAPYQESLALYGEALDAFSRVAREKDARDLVDCARLACCAERWDKAIGFSTRAVALELSATALLYKALATKQSMYAFSFHGQDGDDGRQMIDAALTLPDAWPWLYTFRAEMEPYGNEGQSRKIDILRTGHDRFPNDPSISCNLAELIGKEDPKAGLELVRQFVDVPHPNGRALLLAFRFVDQQDPDTALMYTDRMEEAADRPWAGFAWLRGRIEFDRDCCRRAIEHFQAAAVSKDRAIAYRALLGIAAAAEEERQVDVAFKAIAKAAEHLFNPFDVGAPPPSRTTINEVSADLGDFQDINHLVTVRDLRRDAKAKHPQEPSILAALDLVEYFAVYGEDGRAESIPVIESAISYWNDPRLLRPYAVVLFDNDRLQEAFTSALRYAVWLAVHDEAGDLLEAFGHVNFWQTEAWDDDKGEDIEINEKEQLPFHHATLAELRNVIAAGYDEEVLHRVLNSVFTPLYVGPWRDFILKHKPIGEAEQVVEALSGCLDRDDYLFDLGYIALERRSEKACAKAEELYRAYLDEFKPTPGAMNNLGVALERQGRFEDAAVMYDTAASLATGAQEYQDKAKRCRDKAAQVEREVAERRTTDERARRKQADFLATAPERWPKLQYYQRQLLATLSAISGFSNFNELAELAGQDKRFVETHYRKLVEAGMVVDEGSSFRLNPHIEALVDRERSHAVTAQIIRADANIAFKPIFNSKNEYRFYQVMVEIFPNNLVLPNLALQAIFSYDRMKELLTTKEFGYFLMASVDFCITSTGSYLPLVAFEADSYWHDEQKQKGRDAVKQKIFSAGGIDLIRLRPYGRPSETALRGDVIQAVRDWLSGRRLLFPGERLDLLKELDTSQLELSGGVGTSP